ncbi:MAG: RNA polymerase sigma-70 factor, ECF subfamily [Parcubacteria group bacterium Gr01-1014_13]|nr:MAG: RNA polymerase sigma-70 factor, ECF subfamily [Parcubacteria group bacterium Gr01-1014_13]
MNKKAEFEKFYSTHVDKVYRFVYFRIGADKMLAQDLVSEIFIKALEHFVDYDEKKSHSAWIFTIARNHLANHWRDKKPTSPLPEDENNSNEDFWLKSAINSGKKDMAKHQIRELLEKLDENSREIVTFHYLLGYSYAEIADMKDMSETAIKVAAHRALKKLSEIV